MNKKPQPTDAELIAEWLKTNKITKHKFGETTAKEDVVGYGGWGRPRKKPAKSAD